MTVLLCLLFSAQGVRCGPPRRAAPTKARIEEWGFGLIGDEWRCGLKLEEKATGLKPVLRVAERTHDTI